MSYLIVDAHAHLWKELKGEVDNTEVKSLGGGRAAFQGSIRQMMPPYMIDGSNTAEVFLANMDYGCVSAAVITQEYIDGNQNEYLLEVKNKYPDRFKICGMTDFRKSGYLKDVLDMCNGSFDCIKIPAQRLIWNNERVYLTEDEMLKVFDIMEQKGVILSIDLAEGDMQVEEMKTIISTFPKLKIAIGHFGMVNRPNWESQILLAENKNVMIESGGITWLFHNEFYPYKGAIEAIKRAIELVGIDKLMWGSDYPRTMTAITYNMAFDFVMKTKELSEAEKSKFLGENAVKFYGFNSLQKPMYVKNMVED